MCSACMHSQSTFKRRGERRVTVDAGCLVGGVADPVHVWNAPHNVCAQLMCRSNVSLGKGGGEGEGGSKEGLSSATSQSYCDREHVVRKV